MSNQTVRVCDICKKPFVWKHSPATHGAVVVDFYTHNDLDAHIECYEKIETFLRKLDVPKFSCQSMQK